MSISDNIRLDTWKEIARYLNRDLRTVRRWEKERGLPVHRVPGGGIRAVYAFRDEVDSWLQQTNIAETPEIKTEVGGATASPGLREKESILTPPRQISESIANGPEGKAVSLSQSEGGATQRLGIGEERRSASVAGTLILLTASIATLMVLGWLLKGSRTARAGDDSDPIRITSISPILPRPDQTIYIRGQGFGLHTRFAGTDSPFIAIRDLTGGWAAGRIVPQNWDEVTIDVASWEDSQIVISRFSGAYGSQGWKLRPRDKIEVAVWNPQTDHGPALYHLSVSPAP